MKPSVALLVAMLLWPLAPKAQEDSSAAAEAAEAASPTRPIGLEPAELENWFFSFLERFLNLIADFILQIIQGTLGAIGGLF